MMDREEAIKIFQQMKKILSIHNSDAERTIEALGMAIEALQAKFERDYLQDVVNKQWIPCGERLPEEQKKTYWICTDNGYQCECRWTNINHIWTDLTRDWHWHIADVPQFSKVVAWMPLPDPYREEDTE